MKTIEIAVKYHISKEGFEKFLRERKKIYTEGLLSMTVDDVRVPAYVEEYRTYEKEQKEKKRLEEEEKKKRLEIEAREKAERDAEKAVELSKILVSSGFNFDGYKIVRYSGYISGDDATQIPRSGVFGGHNGENLTRALVRIRRQALTELKEAAYNLGCNAIIGVDFDYITLEPETANINGGTLYEPYIICVTANGNAVVIEKIED